MTTRRVSERTQRGLACTRTSRFAYTSLAYCPRTDALSSLFPTEMEPPKLRCSYDKEDEEDEFRGEKAEDEFRNKKVDERFRNEVSQEDFPDKDVEGDFQQQQQQGMRCWDEMNSLATAKDLALGT